MLGDANAIMQAVLTQSNLRRAFRFAINERCRHEHFFNPFEIEAAKEEETIRSVYEDLRRPSKFTPSPAFSYFPPKADLCFRRMVYLPLKDLVLRYAVVTIIADLLDSNLSDNCFANRRATGQRAKSNFLENFAEDSWPRFCLWQRTCAESLQYKTLIRTDISSFYDSISHNYLVEEISSQLAISPSSAFMNLFATMLKIPVLSICPHTRRTSVDQMQQGLPIGPNTEGFLANLYLRHVDEAMEAIPNIQFGRYNDDMRIFAKSKSQARTAILALQHRLLNKGLNLNSSKTEYASTKTEIESLRSKLLGQFEYEDLEDPVPRTRFDLPDKPFEEFEREFISGQPLERKNDAKDFCHFLARKLPRNERGVYHIDQLLSILVNWPGNSRHATWLLVETFVFGANGRIRQYAKDAVIAALDDKKIVTYAKCRLLHHLTRQRTDGQRYIHLLTDSEKQTLIKRLSEFLGLPAFELAIMSLYSLKSLGVSVSKIDRLVSEKISKPLPHPIHNALLLIKAKKIPIPRPVNAVEIQEGFLEAEY